MFSPITATRIARVAPRGVEVLTGETTDFRWNVI
jgi:hypothetical protein